MNSDYKKVLQDNQPVFAVISIIIGLILVFFRRFAVVTLVRVVGIMCLLGAAAFAVMYFTRKERNQVQAMFAIGTAIVGFIFAAFPGFIVELFPILFGITLILSGIGDLGQALSSNQGGSGKILMVILSAAIILAGILAIFRPGFIADIIIVFIGVCMIANGIFDLFVVKQAS